MEILNTIKKNKNVVIAGLVVICAGAYLYNKYQKDMKSSDEDMDGTTDATSASFTGNERAFANFGGKTPNDPMPCVKPCPCSDNGAMPYTPPNVPNPLGGRTDVSPNPDAPFVAGGSIKPKTLPKG